MRNITLMASQWKAESPCGKNLFKYPYENLVGNLTEGLVCKDKGNGIIELSGDIKYEIDYASLNLAKKLYLKKGTYTLSFGSDINFYRMDVQLIAIIRKKRVFYWVPVDEPYTFEMDDADYIDVWFEILCYNEDVNYTNIPVITLKPQLERGDTATEFETYQTQFQFLHFEACKGGYFSTKDEYGLKVVGKTAQDGEPTPDAPIPIQCVKAGTKVWCGGKNLLKFNIRKFERYGLTFDSTENGVHIYGNATASQNTSGVIYHLITDLPAGSYTPANDVGNGIGVAVQIMKADGTLRYATDSFTIDGTEQYVRCYLVVSANVIGKDIDFWFYPQLEIGSTATPYEPYIGNEITIPVDLYEGDEYYPMSGRVVRKSRTDTMDSEALDNAEIIEIFDADTGEVTYRNITGFITHSPKPDMGNICSKLKSDYCIGTINTSDMSGCTAMIFSSFGINTLKTTAGCGFTKEWFQIKIDEGNPFKVVYPIKNPMPEQNDEWRQPIWAPSGTVNVLQTPTDLTADLSAKVLVRR